MNKVKTRRQKALGLFRGIAGTLAVAAAATLFGGTPAHAVNPIMHNSSSTQSKYWGGSWGNTPLSQYGQFTCNTCHTAGAPSGNAKGIRSTITIGVNQRSVVFGSYTAFGDDSGHTSSNHVCDVCHTKTSHHRYDNSANGANHKGNVDCTSCHLHSNGFRSGESPGGSSCDGCHSDLYLNASGYGMHSNTPGVSYKHYLDNAKTTSDATLTGGTFGTSWYATNVPNSTNVAPAARRCLMCHVDHDQFKGNRAFNLRPNVSTVPNRGMNRDDNLCLSCHDTEKTKAVIGPNGETKTMPIPYPNLAYGNATTVLNNSTHGYSVTSTYGDGTTFNAVCVKCHNDSIGRNGEGPKSSYAAQKGTNKFGEHNSTVPARFAIFGNDFYQRPASGTSLTLNSTNKTVQVVPSPNWDTDVYQGFYVVITNGSGANSRAVITTNTGDTLTLGSWPTGMDNTSMFDVADDNLPIENVCFSCHSKSGEEKSSGANLDWYGQKSMTSSLEGIYDIFVGDSGRLNAAISRRTSVTVYLTSNTWTSTSIKGYRLWTPGGARIINAITAGPTSSGNASYPYSYTLTLASSLTSAAGSVQVVKPAAHPLDGFARHESDERVSAGPGWNKGDTGVSVTANSATAATQITDTTKTWSGSEFNGLTITFPGVFDANGKWVTSTVNGGAAGTITFNPSVSGLSTTGGDNYFIGTRHVSCADCHNPHASFKNPEGTVSSATATTLTDSSLVNVNGWTDNIWASRLIKARSSAGYEQLRFVTAFNKATGTYTVSIPWTTIPDTTYSYEIQMGDVWTSVGQSGGRAGSGSSGVWGVVPTGWRKPTTYGNMTGVVGLRKIQNVFDNLSTTGLGGSTVAGQRDLCVRCHSSYAFGNVTPMLPSGGPAANSNARGTDVLDEFNPNNPAHHAVYTRGRNQPIIATGDVAGGKSAYNGHWPAFGSATSSSYNYHKPALGGGNDTTKTVSINTSGVVTFNASIPSTVRPGWMIYINGANGGAALSQGATKGWFEVATVDSSTQVTVRPKPTASYSNSYFKLTAGLGNNFVPPVGPWAILRCTDCHGSTKTDPVGPHASINSWLIKSLDTSLSFDWFNGSSVVSVTPNTGAVSTIFCFNCHRRDVYGDANSYNDNTAIGTNKIPYRSFTRLAHSGGTGHPDGTSLTGFFTQDTRLVSTSALTWKDVTCRHCHVGDKIGGIHGTNAVASNATAPNNSKGQGKRFLNGASWNGYNMPATGSATCYTVNTNSVSTCGRTTYNTTTSGVLYNYTSAR
ncbi:cytochrome c3 family protein [Geomesophilobacter sediminis]|uniref:Cytochrome c3 family protein n=1 Tax=Geomesophilobacter sediminis TaxID=2798584 RepID=A0A8J7JA50_9BACT|nr:cytochrome c3 family protein [Geomesophilobacter sediminis]MBJ6723113.1 cytochrome c3 family protein [Geomesophilobacter sediminis]